MKKYIMILLCLCALLLPGFTSQDPEMNKGVEVIQAFFDAVVKGDIDTMLKLTAKEHRDDYYADKIGDDAMFKIAMFIFQYGQFKVTGVEKGATDEYMHVEVWSRFPDPNYVIDTAMEKYAAKHGAEPEDADEMEAIRPYLQAILNNKAFDRYTEFTQDFRLVKENGEWRFDENF